MGVNEPLPGQLTVGQLRRLLDGIHDQAVVALRVHETVEVPPPFRFVLTNLKVASARSPIVILEVQEELSNPPPDPAD